MNSAVDSSILSRCAALEPASRSRRKHCRCAEASAMTDWTSGTFGQVVDAALSSWVHLAIAKKKRHTPRKNRFNGRSWTESLQGVCIDCSALKPFRFDSAWYL